MARAPSQQPTDGELEILKVLWEIEPAGLGPIHAVLQGRRAVAVTTVATMLKMMREKGLVRRDGPPRAYAWSSEVSREAAASGLLGKLVRHVFDGSARRLVAHMIREGTLDDRERAELVELLEGRSDGDAAPKEDDR